MLGSLAGIEEFDVRQLAGVQIGGKVDHMINCEPPYRGFRLRWTLMTLCTLSAIEFKNPNQKQDTIHSVHSKPDPISCVYGIR